MPDVSSLRCGRPRFPRNCTSTRRAGMDSGFRSPAKPRRPGPAPWSRGTRKRSSTNGRSRGSGTPFAETCGCAVASTPVVSTVAKSARVEPVTAVSDSQYQAYVNPQWVRLLEALQMNVRYRRCAGVELHAEDGHRFLDFLSGYCVHNTGHNHPAIVSALQRELGREGPAMLQSHVSDLAG